MLDMNEEIKKPSPRYTEAEIMEAVCCAIGDDGFRGLEVLRILKSDRKEYGVLTNEEYSQSREDFKQYKQE